MRRRLNHRGTETQRGEMISSEGVSRHYALDAVFEQRDIEVDQQAQRLLVELQVSQKLRFMHWQDFLNGFEFHNQLISNDEIQTVAAVEFYSFVIEWQINLLLKWNAR